MAVGLSPMKPLHAAPMRLDFFVAGGIASAKAKPLRHTQKKYESIVSTIAQKGQSKSCLKLFLPFDEKSEKIAP